MLLFWRKRRQKRIEAGRANSGRHIESTHDARKTLILLVVLHVYIVICAFAFQKVEYVESEVSRPNLKGIAANMSVKFNISVNESMGLIQDVIDAAKLDTRVGMSAAWGEFSRAFWFVTILFTTVGKHPLNKVEIFKYFPPDFPVVFLFQLQAGLPCMRGFSTSSKVDLYFALCFS